jgi:hypothetical protein
MPKFFLFHEVALAHELEALKTSRYIHIRWCASEALLALSYANGAGTGFIRALVYFETAWADLIHQGGEPNHPGARRWTSN